MLQAMAGLLAAAEGEAVPNGKPLAPRLGQRSRKEQRHIRIIFQMADPALSPRHKAGDILGRPLSFCLGLTVRARGPDAVTALLPLDAASGPNSRRLVGQCFPAGACITERFRGTAENMEPAIRIAFRNRIQ